MPRSRPRGRFSERGEVAPLVGLVQRPSWEADRTLAFLERTFEQPQERLLADLGRASRLYPELERALHVARPVALDLSADEALWFLADGSPLLEQAGFGVLVPAELRQPARLGAKLRATTESDEGKVDRPSLLGAEGIASHRWEVAVGDITLTEEELRAVISLSGAPAPAGAGAK